MIKNNTTISIMGRAYKIEIRNRNDDKFLKENQFEGYCCESKPLIVLTDLNDAHYDDLTDDEKEYSQAVTLRHEIIHAFLNESGLMQSSANVVGGWARNEEMVDWIAIQYPKIKAVFDKLKI